MAQIDYVRAQSINQALQLLSESGHVSRLLAGGTDLLVYMRHEKPDFTRLVDITRIPELKIIELHGDQIHIGAAVTFSEVAESSIIKENAACLVESALSVGGPAIRNVATLGGNVINAAACADSLPPLVCCDAVAHLQSPQGERSLPVAELVDGPNHTDLHPGELLTYFSMPVFPANVRSGFLKLGRRNAQAISRLSMATAGRLDGNGHIDYARLVSGAATPHVHRYADVETYLLGKTPDTTTLEEAARICAATMVSITGRRWSTDYKETAIQGMAEQGLRAVFGIHN